MTLAAGALALCVACGGKGAAGKAPSAGGETGADDVGGGGSGASQSGKAGATSGQGGAAGAAGSPQAGESSGGSSTDDDLGNVSVLAPLFELPRTVQLLAGFVDQNGEDGVSCEVTVYGDCQIRLCTQTPVQLPRQDAGVITLDSPEANVHLVIEPGANGFYATSTSASGSFAPGQALTVSATGGSIPAFSLQTNFPQLLLVDQPIGEPGPSTNTATATIPRSEPAELTWSRGTPNVQLLATVPGLVDTGSGGTVGIACLFDSTTGANVIPSQILSAVPAGATIFLFTLWSDEPIATSPTINIRTEATTPDESAKLELLLE